MFKHLSEVGHISHWDAFTAYGITRLAARICELRQVGADIVSERRKHPMTGQRYVRYVLES